MTLIDKINQIPKPILIVAVMSIGLALIIYSNPLVDGCQNEVKNFGRDVRGLLRGFQNKKEKTQFAMIPSQKLACRQGNSPGACENYFQSLKKIAFSASRLEPQCMQNLVEEYNNFLPEVSEGIRTFALIAWGAVPPKDTSMRLGWLSQGELYTFCRLKRILQDQLAEEEFLSFRLDIYRNYPQEYPEGLDVEKKILMERPKALRSESNPEGTLTETEVFERSVFSIRCDLYY
jgi:hypothetical protein